MSMSPNNVYIVFDDKFFSFVGQNANILCLVNPHYAIFSVCVCQYCLRPMARTKPNRQERANVQSTLKVTDKSLGTSCVCCYRIVWRVVVFFSMMSGDQGCLVCSVHWLDLIWFSLSSLSLLLGVFDEMQSALSSPGLDSPNSSADITLDTTGELTVEDVKDFLGWVLGLQTSWQKLLMWSHFIELCKH